MSKPNSEEVTLVIKGASILIIGALIGAWLWPYTINHWLAVAHKPALFHWYYGAPMSLLPYARKAVVPIAVLTWIALMFI